MAKPKKKSTRSDRVWRHVSTTIVSPTLSVHTGSTPVPQVRELVDLLMGRARCPSVSPGDLINLAYCVRDLTKT